MDVIVFVRFLSYVDGYASYDKYFVFIIYFRIS
jgi:hypothetical protein